MSQTANLGLQLTGTSAEEKSMLFETWRQQINGPDPSSNMNIIDHAFGELKASAGNGMIKLAYNAGDGGLDITINN